MLALRRVVRSSGIRLPRRKKQNSWLGASEAKQEGNYPLLFSNNIHTLKPERYHTGRKPDLINAVFFVPKSSGTRVPYNIN